MVPSQFHSIHHHDNNNNKIGNSHVSPFTHVCVCAYTCTYPIFRATELAAITALAPRDGLDMVKKSKAAQPRAPTFDVVVRVVADPSVRRRHVRNDDDHDTAGEKQATPNRCCRCPFGNDRLMDGRTDENRLFV